MEKTEVLFKALLAIVLVVAFNGLVAGILLLVDLDAETKKLIAMGAIATSGSAFTTAVGFWLGSSQGSAKKDQAIANLSGKPSTP